MEIFKYTLKEAHPSSHRPKLMRSDEEVILKMTWGQKTKLKGLKP